jgi:N-hydroxyarylamine O-acetyltransferase
MSSGNAFDLSAYLDRIGTGTASGLWEIHRAHALAIPFENLDPRRGVPVSLEPGDLQRKMVGQRRGGYCFEQNLLLAAALEALGARVELMLGRVRYGAPGTLRPRTHLALRVHDDDGVWHADAGFGSNSMTEPLPFGPGEIHDQHGWRFRVVQDGPELVLQGTEEGRWNDFYSFIPEPVPRVDVETSNWWTATHPHSRFVTGLNVGRQRPDGIRISLSDWSGELRLTQQTPERRTVTVVELEQVPELLDDVFGLPGFELDHHGVPQPAERRLVRGPDGASRPHGRRARELRRRTGA